MLLRSIRKENIVLVVLTIVALILSGSAPFDRTVWYLESFPVLLGLPFLLFTSGRFPLSRLACRLLFLHGLILLLGAHFSYARVPVGFWVQDLFDLSRNHYDRLGHIAQGFVPAIVAREVLSRRSPLRGSRWLPFLTGCFCLSLSACYEFLEWGTALVGGYAAEEFLATQGDVWDTQWDMFLALCGAVTALILLSRVHDREMALVEKTSR